MYTGKATRNVRGIQDFAEHDFYWGMANRERMREFLELARRVGYGSARKEFDFKVEKPAKFRQYVDSFERADFHYSLPLTRDSMVLDLGSGYGNITIPLARHCAKVVAVDTSLELLEFIKLRAEDEGLTNIEYVHVDPFEYRRFPFEEGSFDAIIMSGVLEWVGAAKLDENPRTLQNKLLARMHALLKRDGFLYLAIENRWFPDYFKRDPHSKLRYTTQLPRFFANWYARLRGHVDGYRTYIYGYYEYRRMLLAAGFSHIGFSFPFPSYRNPRAIWPERPEITDFVLKDDAFRALYSSRWRSLIRALSRFVTPGLFLSSFMILAAKGSGRRLPSVLAGLEGYEYGPGDSIVKYPSDDQDRATFLLFKDRHSSPYARIVVSRRPAGGKASSIYELIS